MTGTNYALSKPPEGALVGEDVPRENELDDWDETLIQRIEALLKSHGDPYVSMSDAEIREQAINKLQKLDN